MNVVGAVAQLGERCNRTAEVEGSTPFRSTFSPSSITPFLGGLGRVTRKARPLAGRPGRPGWRQPGIPTGPRRVPGPVPGSGARRCRWLAPPELAARCVSGPAGPRRLQGRPPAPRAFASHAPAGRTWSDPRWAAGKSPARLTGTRQSDHAESGPRRIDCQRTRPFEVGCGARFEVRHDRSQRDDQAVSDRTESVRHRILRGRVINTDRHGLTATGGPPPVDRVFPQVLGRQHHRIPTGVAHEELLGLLGPNGSLQMHHEEGVWRGEGGRGRSPEAYLAVPAWVGVRLGRDPNRFGPGAKDCCRR